LEFFTQQAHVNQEGKQQETQNGSKAFSDSSGVKVDRHVKSTVDAKEDPAIGIVAMEAFVPGQTKSFVVPNHAAVILSSTRTAKESFLARFLAFELYLLLMSTSTMWDGLRRSWYILSRYP